MSTEGIDLIYSANGTVIGANYYAYVPSGAAGWTFTALFAGTTLAHFIAMFPQRAAFFIPLIIGGIMETFGYQGRARASTNPNDFGAWAQQAFLIICAPPMISATIYMSLGRMITALDAREHALMSPRATTPLFVCGDIIAFVSQLAGIGLQAARSASANANGKKIVLAGLIFQLFLFGFFIVNIIVFQKRNARHPTLLSIHPQMPRWRRYTIALLAVSACVLLRNFVRVIEYAEGGKGQITTHEVFLYLFDAVLMWIVTLGLLIFHPGRLLKLAKRMGESLERGTIPLTDRQDKPHVPAHRY